MSDLNRIERDQFQQLLGARDEQVRQLERQVRWLAVRLESEAKEWRRLLRHRDELADWLVDQATDQTGQLIQSRIDAGLRGESFIPGTLTTFSHGRTYRIDLVTMDYEVQEILGNG